MQTKTVVAARPQTISQRNRAPADDDLNERKRAIWCEGVCVCERVCAVMTWLATYIRRLLVRYAIRSHSRMNARLSSIICNMCVGVRAPQRRARVTGFWISGDEPIVGAITRAKHHCTRAAGARPVRFLRVRCRENRARSLKSATKRACEKCVFHMLHGTDDGTCGRSVRACVYLW